jgi:aminopeptidase N
MKGRRHLTMWAVGLVLLGAASALAAGTPDSERLLERVQTLTAPTLAGRGSGTPEMMAAADTLAAWLTTAGLQPVFDGSWYQEFDLTGEGWAGNDLAGHQDRNVAGILPGTGELADRFIIIGAHFDHLGRVVPAVGTAPTPGPDEYYPGANDNASGVTVVWELINLIQARPASTESRRSLLVVFFGGEEVGLQGSGHFVAHPPLDLARVDAMINFDTVGQLTDNRLYVSGIGTAEALPALVQAANTDGLDLSLGQGGWSGSDHMSFNTREVPVLFVFGGPYVQYNRPADTWDSLSPASLVKVAAYSDRLLDLLRATPEPLTWVMVAEKNLREGETEGANRDTWFGSLPDFTEDIKGYKLAGVFDNSPAARSGLQKGDVLVRMAGQDIIDLPSFTRVLRSHAPGDLVEVEILRAGNPLRFTVVMGNRSERQ